MDATTSSEPDRVLFAPGLTGTLTLTSGELQVPGGVDVIGPGAKQLTISGGGQSRIFHAANADPPVTFSNLTLANGMSTPGGGAIASQGTVTLSGMVLRDN